MTDDLVIHLEHCRKVVAPLIEAGWTYEGVEYVAGKRVRYLVPPPARN